MTSHPAEVAAAATKARQRVKNPNPAPVIPPARDRVKATEPAGTPAASAASASRPTNKATKAEWIAYAEQVGGETLDPDEWTKADLIGYFGDA